MYLLVASNSVFHNCSINNTKGGGKRLCHKTKLSQVTAQVGPLGTSLSMQNAVNSSYT